MPSQNVSFPDAGFRSVVVENPDEFQDLRSVWSELLESSRVDDAWMTHEWLERWWQSFGTTARLFIPMVWADRRPVAAAPMMVVRMRIKGLTWRVLRFIENGITPRSQFLIADGHTEGASELWRLISGSSREWDMAILTNLPHGEHLDAWRSALTESGMRYVESPARESPYVDLCGDFQEYRKTLSPKMRDNISQSRNRLSKLGTIGVQSVLGTDETPAALETCFEISARSWKAAFQTDLGGSEEHRSFYRSIVTQSSLRSRLYIWILTLDGEPIAFNMVIRSGGTVTGLATDYDLAYKHASPGVYLLARVLEDLTTVGVTRCDMSGHSQDYKKSWTKELLAHSQFWVFHRGVRSSGLYLAKSCLLRPADKRETS